jgi:serine palmitoyltransferase
VCRNDPFSLAVLGASHDQGVFYHARPSVCGQRLLGPSLQQSWLTKNELRPKSIHQQPPKTEGRNRKEAGVVSRKQVILIMGIAMKDRLRRLLMSNAHQKFRKETDHHHGGHTTSSSTADTCSTSHETDSNSDECGGGGSGSNGDTTTNSIDAATFAGFEDPYADVRDKLERLVLANRKRNGIVPYDDDEHELQMIDHHKEEEDEFVPAVDAYLVYVSYGMLILLGKLYDTIRAVFGWVVTWWYRPVVSSSLDYAPLLKSWEDFYTRHVYDRVQDAFNRPIGSNPGAVISVLERASTNHMKTMQVIGPLEQHADSRLRSDYENGPHYTTAHNGAAARRCINLGSYNYLGFADDWQNTCATAVTNCLDDFAPSTSSSRGEFGTTILHEQLERIVADFLGKDDALVLNMGFNVNASVIPTLMNHGDLILSDELNHTSIVAGARGSGAAIRVFGHNDMKSLEHALREAVIMGRPRTRRPWNRIWVLVEGIYSMEGEYCNLRDIVSLCQQYGAYIYLDEAHSIGSMGATGRGVTEYCGVDPADIHIMMGTFTKSFGGMGGYIAADQTIIDVLRERCAASVHHNSLPPVVCQQVITAFQVRCIGPHGDIPYPHNTQSSFSLLSIHPNTDHHGSGRYDDWPAKAPGVAR